MSVCIVCENSGLMGTPLLRVLDSWTVVKLYYAIAIIVVMYTVAIASTFVGVDGTRRDATTVPVFVSFSSYLRVLFSHFHAQFFPSTFYYFTLFLIFISRLAVSLVSPLFRRDR